MRVFKLWGEAHTNRICMFSRDFLDFSAFIFDIVIESISYLKWKAWTENLKSINQLPEISSVYRDRIAAERIKLSNIYKLY